MSQQWLMEKQIPVCYTAIVLSTYSILYSLGKFHWAFNVINFKAVKDTSIK